MTGIKDGWAMLAASIVEDGQKHNDTLFLESEWCKELKEFCRLSSVLNMHVLNHDQSYGNLRGITDEQRK